MYEENTVDGSSGVQALQDDAAMEPTPQVDELTLGEAIGMGDTVEQTSDDAAAALPDGMCVDTRARQRAVDRAMGQRIFAEREKTQRRVLAEHAPDLDLAKLAREALGEQALPVLQAMAQRQVGLADSAEHAPELDLAKMAREALGEQALPVLQAMVQRQVGAGDSAAHVPDGAHARVEALAQQADAILASSGVNMVEVLRADSALRERVAAGELDLRAAYGHHMETRQIQPSRARVPGAIRGGANSASMQKSIENMSQAEFERLEEQLARGRRVYF